MTNKKVKNFCNECGQKTNHDVIGISSSRGDENYEFLSEHMLVQCRGCETVSFSHVFHEIESAYPIDEFEWEVPKVITNYPAPSISNIDAWHIPSPVDDIYTETCKAFADGSLTLAGMGFRATIEAICNEQNINGKELSTRINNLASRGLISKKDSVRLHSIRFMGNDAAHEIRKPTKDTLNSALTIVEHLLTTVYILDSGSRGGLERMIEEYVDFESLLLKKIDDFEPNDEYPLQAFLSKDVRLIGGSLKQMEKELNAKIGKGDFLKLAFGKEDHFAGSKEKLQHYIVQDV
ncbi:TPA: DUF4145 domain-containing protein [Yersinia enterocolitica]|nr:DUF4145 domain-containing protein [Yersinia enterocolitica]HEM8996430.1 DUF4145 domain-containing protein [Yersinia enterocolitica]HEO8480179.1 DUF4145 domain-containing protein [Yersinia enterocolitica]